MSAYKLQHASMQLKLTPGVNAGPSRHGSAYDTSRNGAPALQSCGYCIDSDQALPHAMLRGTPAQPLYMMQLCRCGKVRRCSLENAVRVVALRLARGGSIKGPVRELLGVHAGDGLLDDLGLGAHLIEQHPLQDTQDAMNGYSAWASGWPGHPSEGTGMGPAQTPLQCRQELYAEASG